MGKILKIILAVVFFILVFKKILLFAGEDFRLEGVVEDKNPAHSLAVINGQPYLLGDALGDFKITRIVSHEVTLTNQTTGSETVLLVKEALKPVPSPAPTALQEKDPSLLEQMAELIKNPRKIGNMALELKAIRELAIINNAAVRYYEKNKFFPVKLRQLTLDGFLNKEYESGKRGVYQFYLTNQSMSPDDFQLHADPQEPASGLRYYFVGPDALIRVSEGKAADASSPSIKPMRK